jgi:hypothetical protein
VQQSSAGSWRSRRRRAQARRPCASTPRTRLRATRRQRASPHCCGSRAGGRPGCPIGPPRMRARTPAPAVLVTARRGLRCDTDGAEFLKPVSGELICHLGVTRLCPRRCPMAFDPGERGSVMRVLGLMVLLALTGCQSPPPLDTAQAQCQAPGVDNTNGVDNRNSDRSYCACACANKHELVGAYGGRRYGGQLP